MPGSLFHIILILLFAFLGYEPTTEKPNILLIVADDLGYEMLSCYGGLSTSTPELDQMAAEGLLFESAYASAVCTPSRMSLYTGLYASSHQYTTVLPVHKGTREFVDFSKWPTHAMKLKKAGYTTSVTGKWQLATLEHHPSHCRDSGFDSWCVWQIWREGAKTTRYWKATYNQDGRIREDIEDRFGPDVMTDYVIGQMRKAKAADKPFFIQHNMVLPHVPIIETPDDKALGRAASLNHMIEYLDKQVGVLLDSLHALGLAANTYVFFIGDNGTQAEAPRSTKAGMVTGGKWKLQDGGIHIPMIAYCPGSIAAGKRVGAMIDIADFHPTFCEMAGIGDPEKNVDGLSFAGLLYGKEQGHRQWVTAGLGDDFCVFDGQWRLHRKGSNLYDCRHLPSEKEAEMDSEKAEAAMVRLSAVLEELRNK